MFALHDSVVQPGMNGALVILKISFILIGLYIWEFITSLQYEWDVIRGRQPYRWTIWIYICTRLATATFVIFTLVFDSMTSQLNCPAWIQTSWTFSFLSLSSASLLIVLRTVAIWNMNKAVVAFTAIVWVTNVSLQIRGITVIRAEWVPVTRNCALTNLESCKPSLVGLLVTDLVLLLTMFAGLLRLSRRDAGTFALGRFLWKQGLLWLVIATAAELPQVVFVTLDTNAFLKLLFTFPSVIMMSIAGTRIHRSLQHFAHSTNTHVPGPDDLQKTRSSRLVSKARDPSVIHIPSDRLEVTVHTETAYEYPVSQMKHYGSYTDKPRNISIDGNVKGRGGKTA